MGYFIKYITSFRLVTLRLINNYTKDVLLVRRVREIYIYKHKDYYLK